MRLLRIGVLVSLAIVLLVNALPARAAVGVITISPATGQVGTSVTISGTNFTAATTYTVFYDGASVLTGTIAAGGILSAASFPVPASIAGAHNITVTTSGGDTSNIAVFTVTPRITLSSTTARVGETLTVTGNGFAASSTVTIYLDTISTTTVASAANGIFSISFAVPQGADGFHTVTATDASANSTSATYRLVGPELTLSSTTAQAGSVLTVSGTGFAANSSVSISIDFVSTATTTATSSGSFSVNLTIPQGAGETHTISATDSTGRTGSATYKLTRAITLNGSSFAVGATLTINGNSFGANSTVTINIDGVAATTATSNASGSFTAGLPVPPGTSGTHTVTATDSLSNMASSTYTITPSITVSPSPLTSGTQFSANGTGFAATSVVSFYLDGTVFKSDAAVTSALGSFTGAGATISALPGGSHNFQVKDASTNAVTLSFTVSPRMTVNPQTGVSGTSVQVSGSGFSASKTVTLGFDTAGTVASSVADAVGSFTTSFAVPAISGGSHSVSVTDGALSASAIFTVLGSSSLNPAKGSVGASVAVSGVSFASRGTITISYDGSPVATATADNNGAFTASFTIPAGVTGIHSIGVTDGTRNTSLSFSMLASMTVNPASGNVGTPVTLTGTGFTSSLPVAIKYDARQIGTATTNATGGFIATFNAPASVGGNHAISATDGSSTVESTFSMDSTPPPIPALLSPGDAARFGVTGGAAPTLSWSSVADPSGVTYILQIDTGPDFSQPVLEGKNLTSSRYAVASTQALPYGEYYWRVRAIDGASNESAWSQPRLLKSGVMPLWSLILIIVLVVAAAGGGTYFGLTRRRARVPEAMAVPRFDTPQVVPGQWRMLESEEAARERHLPLRLALPQSAKKGKMLSTEDEARLKVIIDFARSLPLVQPGYTVDWLVDLLETGMGIQVSAPIYEQMLKGELQVRYEPTWRRHPAYQDLTTLLEGQAILQDMNGYVDSVEQCAFQAVSLLQDIYADAKSEVSPDFLERGGWGFISAVYADCISWFQGKSLRDPSDRDYTIKTRGGPDDGARWLSGEDTTSFPIQLILAPSDKEALLLRDLHLKLRRNARNNSRAKQVAAMIAQLDVQRSRLLNVFSQFG